MSDVFYNALSTVAPDSTASYTMDRDKAFRWYLEKGFPNPSLDSLPNVKWFISMSIRADEDSLWDEAWAGFHHALAGCLQNNLIDKLPDICWHLGRTHTGLANYDLAELYLETGHLLAKQQGNSNLTLRTLLEKAVVNKITQQTESAKEIYQQVEDHLFSTTPPLAEKALLSFFNEGIKNQEWRKNGKPIRRCLIHASGFYEVSLDLSRRLGNRKAIAITLINLGDVWRKLSQRDDAFRCWNEALQFLEELGDQKNIALVKQWMSET